MKVSYLIVSILVGAAILLLNVLGCYSVYHIVDSVPATCHSIQRHDATYHTIEYPSGVILPTTQNCNDGEVVQGMWFVEHPSMSSWGLSILCIEGGLFMLAIILFIYTMTKLRIEGYRNEKYNC